MFEVGARYEFRVIEGGDETLFWGVVERYEHPLIKLQDVPDFIQMPVDDDEGMGFALVENPDGQPTPGAIINVTSPNFVSAVKQPHR